MVAPVKILHRRNDDEDDEIDEDRARDAEAAGVRRPALLLPPRPHRPRLEEVARSSDAPGYKSAQRAAQHQGPPRRKEAPTIPRRQPIFLQGHLHTRHRRGGLGRLGDEGGEARVAHRDRGPASHRRWHPHRQSLGLQAVGRRSIEAQLLPFAEAGRRDHD
eukprot:CAMPEP_0176143854 /NCGR_PEP_ID=MMETSP0120_2-20121206/73225_1 /TAXON_ID=160619 /ORGANISM="Kryptoperidinium foliaceum, Strain CCMP 1326" /LENGTH=160 /DNA_ID=CAMNT_0017480183 /DNA_START=113 /DNA_END=592 /DNA_ORIENTATION=+